MTTMTSIAQNLKAIRKAKNLTQKQVAEACGMVDATYRTYELGKANPKPKTVARLAKGLGVSVPEVYGLPENTKIEDLCPIVMINQTTEDALLSHLIATYHTLNKTGKREAIKRLEEMTFIPKYKE